METNQDIIRLLAERFKSYRLAARMSQQEVADTSGVSRCTIANFEQGADNNLTINNYISLLKAIGMEDRIKEVLPELPMSIEQLEMIRKLVEKSQKKK